MNAGLIDGMQVFPLVNVINLAFRFLFLYIIGRRVLL